MAIHCGRKEVDGVVYLYEYKRSWGHTYRSFDGGATWFRTSREAFQQAKAAGKLYSEQERKQEQEAILEELRLGRGV